MNSESSRSHAIFSITIETSRPDVTGEYHVKVGRLRLVDLAVSLLFIIVHINMVINVLLILFIKRVLNDSQKLVLLVYDLKRRQKLIYLFQHLEMSFLHWLMVNPLIFHIEILNSLGYYRIP